MKKKARFLMRSVGEKKNALKTNENTKKFSLARNLIRRNDDNSNSTNEIPVFLGGLKPLSENQKSPTFMPVEKGVPTNKALNGEDFDNLNYTRANNLKIHLKNETQGEIAAGYYGESRLTYYY